MATSDGAAIEVRNLSKRFGEVQAVGGVSFDVRRGETFSLLGPNGAGKSTTISILCGLLRPTAGDALLLGASILREPRRAKRVIGLVPQEVAFYADLSARENLLFWGRMAGLSGPLLLERVREVLALTGLSERQRGASGKFSGGMKRRLNIGIALLHDPAVVIMDEPTVGIDPQSRRSILDAVKDLNARGKTVLYTTHYMEEAQELSHRIAIMDHGRLIASGTYAQLLADLEEDRTVTVGCPDPQSLTAALAGGLARDVRAGDSSLTFLTREPTTALDRLFVASRAGRTRITEVTIREPNLEAVFLRLTGRGLRDGAA